MEIDTANLIKGIIGSIVRFLLAGAVGWLVQRGIITGEQGAALIPAIVLGVITVAWAIWRKYKIQQRIAVALSLPAGSGPETLDRAVSEQNR
jgi:fluoride ion exporter CrcB/FEX